MKTRAIRSQTQKSRTVNSVLNGVSGILVQLLTTLLTFLVRTVFVKCLDDSYLGVNGLFSNIFTLLSLAELGIGNAIIFRLYKPIAENDYIAIKRLVAFYRKCYTWIAVAVGAIAAALLPFLRYLVKTDTAIEGLYVIYLIYVLDTVASYAFTHKISLITACQRERTVSLNTLYTNVVTSILQILSLLFFRSFYLYLIIKIVCYIVFRYVLARKVNQEYPYISESPRETVSPATAKEIFYDVKALFAYKVGSALLNGSDNIIISAFIGTNQVGIYSNYYLIISAVKTLMVRLLHGFTASIGNLNAVGDRQIKRNVFFQVNYITFFMFSFGSACLYALTEDFISLWIGTKYLFDSSILLVLIVCFYVSGCNQIIMTYRDTAGLFRKGWYMPLATAAVNIALSIVGAQKWGLLGVFTATYVSQLLTRTWFDPFLVCRHTLSINPFLYYWRYLFFALVAGINVVATNYFCLWIKMTGILGFALKCIVSMFSALAINVVLTFWLPEFKSLFSRCKQLIRIR